MNHPLRGFTLLEVLLATTLLAAGLMLALVALRAAGVSVERTQTLSAREEQIRAVEGFLRRRLTSALPIGFGQQPGSGRRLRFVGEPERVLFVADVPPYLGRGGPGLHELVIHQEVNGQSWLGIRFASVLAGQVIEEPASLRPPEVLMEDVRTVRMRYRSRDMPGQPGEWSERWEAVDQLPWQVEITIISASSGAWPPLLVHLPQGGNGGAR